MYFNQTYIFCHQVAWDEVIGEPDGGHSHPCVYKCSYSCFNCAKKFCYYILTFLCAWWMAFCWGCEFAQLTFCHVWYYTPSLKICQINCGLFQKFWATCLNCCLGPMCETFGLVFSKIGVENRSA